MTYVLWRGFAVMRTSARQARIIRIENHAHQRERGRRILRQMLSPIQIDLHDSDVVILEGDEIRVGNFHPRILHPRPYSRVNARNRDLIDYAFLIMSLHAASEDSPR